jgi:hypothetical protein
MLRSALQVPRQGLAAQVKRLKVCNLDTPEMEAFQQVLNAGHLLLFPGGVLDGELIGLFKLDQPVKGIDGYSRCKYHLQRTLREFHKGG